jgi:hypothetical protein
MRFRTNAIHAENFAGHLKTGNLMTSVGGQYFSFEKTQLDCVDRGEWIARMKNCLAARNFLARTDQFIDHCEFLRGQAHGQTKLLQIALRAGGAMPSVHQAIDIVLGDLVHIFVALGVWRGWRSSLAMVDLR